MQVYLLSFIKNRLCVRVFYELEIWLRGLDLNQRPSGYEPDELPDCSTPRHGLLYISSIYKMQA